MKLILESDQRIRLNADEQAFAIEAAGGELSPFHLLAASLATCTWSVLLAWATQADLETQDLQITVDWEFGGDPYQVSGIVMELIWPGLPPERHAAARRAAALCTVHSTLEHGTEVMTRVARPR